MARQTKNEKAPVKLHRLITIELRMPWPISGATHYYYSQLGLSDQGLVIIGALFVSDMMIKIYSHVVQPYLTN